MAEPRMEQDGARNAEEAAVGEVEQFAGASGPHTTQIARQDGAEAVVAAGPAVHTQHADQQSPCSKE